LSAPLSRPLELQHVISAPSVTALPPTTAEIAIAGRSNVGKSSLINALANRRALAHVSKTPGRTQLLNCFEHAGGGTVVDLPGYGYAAVPGRVKATWSKMITTYLLQREELRVTLVLIDGEIGPTKLDVETLEWFRSHELPIAVVATKQDKVASQKRMRRRNELAAGCGVHPDAVAWVSAAKGTGIEPLRAQIRSWLS
jgi:GTP-binding protein